jgi:predicted aspartyl protease
MSIIKNMKMKRVLVMWFVMGAMVLNVSGQTKRDKDLEEMFGFMKEACKMMIPLMAGEELARLNVPIDCYCNAQAEAGIGILQSMDYDNMNEAKFMQFLVELYDEASPLHNEYMHAMTVLLEKNCGTGGEVSSISVAGPERGAVALVKYGGMYKIKVGLGGSEKYFLMDTGAGNSFISRSYARDLEDMGLIRPDDYLEPAEYVDAHGMSVLHKRVRLSGVKIGGFVLDGVIFAIGNDDGGGLLLGKDVLDAFGAWNIDNGGARLELVR